MLKRKKNQRTTIYVCARIKKNNFFLNNKQISMKKDTIIVLNGRTNKQKNNIFTEKL